MKESTYSVSLDLTTVYDLGKANWDFPIWGQESTAASEDFFALGKGTLEQIFVKANLLVMVKGLSGVQSRL